MAEMAREGIDTVRRGARRRRDRAGVGHHGRRRGRAHDRHPPRQADRDRAPRRSRSRWSRMFRCCSPTTAFPNCVRPVCEAARRRGIPIVLDADRPTVEDDPLFRIPTHVIFSGECLRATTGTRRSVGRAAAHGAAHQGVSRGQRRAGAGALSGRRRGSHHAGVQGRSDRHAGGRRRVPRRHRAGAGGRPRRGRGDAVLAPRRPALKCTRFGGSMGAPKRDEVEAFLAKQD